MAEKAKHTDPKDRGRFSKGKAEQQAKKATGQPKDTPKVKEAKASKGGRERRP